ncbi:hypothetical protein YC2023_089591 [Brassica napus]
MSFQLFGRFSRHCRLFQSWLLFFLKFQLMLGTASPWLGQSLLVLNIVFFVVGLPSIVSETTTELVTHKVDLQQIMYNLTDEEGEEEQEQEVSFFP